MRSRIGAWAIVGLAGALLAPACGRAPAVRYEVAFSEAHPDHLAVTLRLDGVPRGGLTLKGFATKEVLRVTGLEAEGPDGRVIPVEAGLDTVSVNGRSLDIPRFGIAGPLPRALTVRYLASPGTREGDSHMGFTGRCEGYAGKEFVFATGRELFLLPQPAESIRRIEVRFPALPAGWTVAAPWSKDGDVWRPGIGGDFQAEHLVSAAIGLGRFRERSFEIGSTRYRLIVEAGVPADQEEDVAARLETAARYLHDLFRRELGPQYLTVVVPRAPTGDDISGEGWSGGQGETLVPLTGNRLHQFALELAEAYLRHAPTRSEIKRADEYWLVDGLKNLYAWRTVAAAGLIREEEVTRGLAVGYLTSLNVQGIERNLEKLYAATGSQTIPREVIAPMVLASLDRALTSAAPGTTGLDTVVGRLFKGRRAESLWSELSRARPDGGWADFRTRYVRGNGVLPVEQFYSLSLTAPAPDPPAGPRLRTLTLAYTGKGHGYLENCGCKVNQSGGVARRATVIEALRKKDPDLLLLDAGDAFVMPDKEVDLDFLTREEQSLYLGTMDWMGYQAAGVGTAELALGLDHFRRETAGHATPFLVANVRANGRPIAPASRVLRAGRLKVAVIGVFEPPRGREANAIFEDHTASLEIGDPVEALKQAVPPLKKQADLVVAIGRLAPVTIRQVAAACPGLDVIISTDYDAAIRLKDGDGHEEIHPEDHSGFVGRTLVAYTALTNYGLHAVRIGLDSTGRITSAEFTEHWLREDVRDEPRVRDMLDRFYDRVGRQAAAQESIRPLFADDPARARGRYVGAAQCESCHAEEYAQWRRTKHGTAYKTLLDRHRHFQPKCVSCHVVGFGTPHGFKLGARTEALANVQCEICHGPGAVHVAAPARTNIQREVPERICLECHTPDHSDHFVYQERLPKVRHDYYD
ncbi:MAG TPA: multiheme c-type cytochrome [Candidatus Polarisedimenticolia bacterium]|nr:multiheme c-type cytochrome [Candidatus Polarisedimenticolia bacterium]